MKQIIFPFLFFIASMNTFAQNPNDAIIIFNGGGTATMMNIRSKPAEIKGSVYYNTNWQPGTLILFSGEEIRDYLLKYDMRMNQINIKTDNDIKIISIGAVKEINWRKENGINEILKNCSVFDPSKEKFGFFTVIYEGNTSLLKKINLKLLPSNYNGTVDVGDKSDKYIKEDNYFIYSNGKLTPVRKSKKKILKFFDNKSEKIEKFVSNNKLNFKNDLDLYRIFDYYNSL